MTTEIISIVGMIRVTYTIFANLLWMIRMKIFEKSTYPIGITYYLTTNQEILDRFTTCQLITSLGVIERSEDVLAKYIMIMLEHIE